MPAVAVRAASPDDTGDAQRLAAAAADDSGALNDVIRGDLVAPGTDSATWFADSGLAHAQRDDRDPASWLLGVSAPADAWPELLVAVQRHVREHGGGTVTWWRASSSDDDIARVAALGYRVARSQHELRVRLPLEQAANAGHAASTEGVELRTLHPDAPGELDAVLAINNAAFAGHPEQGGWSRPFLDERMAKPWFDPSLFIVAVAGRVIGFNWLKPHPASAGDVARGEIYVIAVDPTMHGHGLGRRLAVLGLDRLHERGFEWASLFVAADNEAALSLYRSLGFTTHRTDTAFVADVT
jgi:mycothiol synthase